MLTRAEARAYAAHLIGTEQFHWDRIAEGHPSGEILDQDDCDLVREALESCTVVLLWERGRIDQYQIAVEPQDR